MRRGGEEENNVLNSTTNRGNMEDGLNPTHNTSAGANRKQRSN